MTLCSLSTFAYFTTITLYHNYQFLEFVLPNIENNMKAVFKIWTQEAKSYPSFHYS